MDETELDQAHQRMQEEIEAEARATRLGTQRDGVSDPARRGMARHGAHVLRTTTATELQDKRRTGCRPSLFRMLRPVDSVGAGGLGGFEAADGGAMDAVLGDRNIDAVVVILMLTDETGVPSYDFIVDLAAKYPAKPIYVTFMGQHEHNVAAKAYLEPKGIPAYILVEEPFEVLGVLARCRAALGRGRG